MQKSVVKLSSKTLFIYDYIVKNYGDVSDLVVECVNFLDFMKERPSYEEGV